ncbi:RPM1-interacting protein 4 [Morella rubra]|uniref:RPM1-interacting protein 4 n=1 Tax=Morella rubra TaxID=262757 RepID=A0A6A1VG81_9ROSI|nr:RPM1-interacting protein 4 [Morella rubra]
MASQDKGRPLPKFGEWDVNNPASAEGFTVIFSKARDEKKSNGTAAAGSAASQSNHDNPSKPEENYVHPGEKKKWFCCF